MTEWVWPAVILHSAHMAIRAGRGLWFVLRVDTSDTMQLILGVPTGQAQVPGQGLAWPGLAPMWPCKGGRLDSSVRAAVLSFLHVSLFCFSSRVFFAAVVSASFGYDTAHVYEVYGMSYDPCLHN